MYHEILISLSRATRKTALPLHRHSQSVHGARSRGVSLSRVVMLLLKVARQMKSNGINLVERLVFEVWVMCVRQL